jgi:transcriptional regulator with XRE-family HTH domain
MSNIVDTGLNLARRIADERSARSWSLVDLARRSDVSKSMLSKIERAEASPTAQVLVRIASAFGLTLAELLAEPHEPQSRVSRAADHAVWIDPATGYRRRQLYLSARLPLELVEIELPVGASVAIPASSYALIRQVLWVIAGVLTLFEGVCCTQLQVGDRIEFGAPSDVVFRNDGSAPCRYLVAVLRS